MTPSLLSTLRRVPLFQELSLPELELLAQHAASRSYAAGTVVFNEGDPCDALTIVGDGSVKLLKNAANGRHQLLSIERAGSTLAEVPLFDGGPYEATAEAATVSTLISIHAALFRRFCEQHPPVALKVIKVLGHRLRRMGDLVESLSFSTVRGRLIAHLIRLAEESGRTGADGVEMELTENNEELAGRLGTVRELVSRNLGRLHGEGLIVMRRRALTIPDLAALREEIS